MQDNVFGRIMMYVTIWVGLFVLLCFISIIKNWSVVVTVVSGTIYALIEYIIIFGVIIYAIRLIIGSAFR